MYVLLIIVAVLVLFFVILIYYGIFTKINFSVETVGEELIAFEKVTGSYTKTPRVSRKIFKSLLKHEKIKAQRKIVIYYDNLKYVRLIHLRSEAGCLFEEVDSETLKRLNRRFQLKKLPEDDFAITEFPYKGIFSIWVGISRVYPALDKFVYEQGYCDGPLVQIIDIPNKKIIYRKYILGY